MGAPTITLHGHGVTLRDIERVARHGAPVELHRSVRERILRAREVVERVLQAEIPVYGLNTALGANTGQRLANDELAAYQHSAVRARAVGVGEPWRTDVVRATMLARLCGMAVGGSGVSIAAVELLLAMLNAKVHPVVPSRGSIGAADLAPLAAIALPLIGEGRAEYGGAVSGGSQALQRAGLAPVALSGKDALALISANAATLGHGALVLLDAARMLDLFNLSAALMHEAFRANVSPLDARVQQARHAPAPAAIAARILGLLAGSALLAPGAARRLQDPVSLRCVSQVHGTCLDSLRTLRDRIERDLNAATESPLVVLEASELVSNGNFDTSDIALGFEATRLALAHVAAMTVQRCQRLYSPGISALPLQLTRHGAQHSGFATVQKTLVALLAELRHLALPVMLDGLPVSEAIEDSASLAPLTVARTEAMLPLLQLIAAIELMSAAQAIDLRGTTPGTLGAGTRSIHERVRSAVQFLDHDRPLGPDITALAAALDEGEWPTADLLG